MPQVALLLITAAAVAIFHSLLPDHWVPIAVVARTQHWSLERVARVSFLAAIGHVVTSILLGGVVALIGLQFQHQLDTVQGRLIGGILFVTGLGFLIWGTTGHGHQHDEAHGHANEQHDHDDHDDHHEHDSSHGAVASESVSQRFAAIIVPFGVAASPDLTFLPVALAASLIGRSTIVGVLAVFAIVTLATFVGTTVLATIIGYQIKGDWLERNATTITALVLMGIGIVAFVGF